MGLPSELSSALVNSGVSAGGITADSFPYSFLKNIYFSLAQEDQRVVNELVCALLLVELCHANGLLAQLPFFVVIDAKYLVRCGDPDLTSRVLSQIWANRFRPYFLRCCQRRRVRF